MNTDTIKEGLDGLTKIDNISNVLWVAMYWVGVILVLLVVAWFCVSLGMFIMERQNGVSYKDEDDFLDK